MRLMGMEGHWLQDDQRGAWSIRAKAPGLVQINQIRELRSRCSSGFRSVKLSSVDRQLNTRPDGR